MRKAGTIMVAAVAAVALGACSPSTEEPSDQPPGSDPTPTHIAQSSGASEEPDRTEGSVTTSPGDQGPECTAEDIEVSGEFGAKPEITIPGNCAPPSELLTEDLSEGDGPEITQGSQVEMDYLLLTWADRQEKDTSFGKQPFALTVGNGEVISGWDEGLLGLKEGGRRLLVVPADMAYGNQPNHPLAQDTLVFVVDAVSVSG
ncbi:FKBP-type peptidyl-prolyl cis-trans isomerase [Amycolatopsis cihanbeyliensis]|uniref:Peptidyl-prolyl cis-trans isomerase n=1 Tax=Amycolatopsis cihanbeyliensis TaxID=1128664 RepID=A0A542CSU1_AMYCI|nr:FKBP-type peptidyl-prolyl cis-trans isomerase [Amycolatopsis cihanbeyliensis]TQI93865.1 peptidylprolyl isomerase [Amycolatopsis cihanbeyliensis]